MVGSNLKDQQLQQIVDKTIMEADLDGDGKISFEEFTKMVENTDVSMSMTLGMVLFYRNQLPMHLSEADTTKDQFWYDYPSTQLNEVYDISPVTITNETQSYNLID